MLITKDNKFGKLKIRDSLTVMSGSGKKIWWICDCGKETLVSPNKVMSRRIPSCGRCNEISAEEIAIRKFGKLRMKDPQIVLSGSIKKVWWICDCGKESHKKIYSITSGMITSCGRCNEISAEEMAVRKFGKLRIKNPHSITSGSGKKIWWICDCGKETLTSIYLVTSKHTSSCGLCEEISAEEMTIRKFGKLKIKYPISITPGINRKETWICDCGREFKTIVNLVVNGNTTSCGRCNEIFINTNDKYAKLRIKTGMVTKPYSNKKVMWICDCGKEINSKISLVRNGSVSSCGHCYETVYNWYLENKEKIKALRCPVKPEDFPSGGPKPLEIIKKSHEPFKCICAACKQIYYPTFGDIRYRGISITCGCSYYRISKGQKDVAEYVKSLGFNYVLEYPVNKLKYDIFVPSKNLLIEYNGSIWHSMPKSVERDARKKQNALDNNYEFIVINEKDWNKSKDLIQKLLSDILIS